MPNVKLLNRTLKQVEKHPETWDQTMWRCKTGMCFAGWAAQLSGGGWAFGPKSAYSDQLLANGSDHPSEIHRIRGKDCVTAASRARRLLGITQYESSQLFSAGNELEQVRQWVRELSA